MLRIYPLVLLIALSLLPNVMTAQARLPDALPDSIIIEDNAWNLVRSHYDSYTLVHRQDGYVLFENASAYSKGRQHMESLERIEMADLPVADVQRLIRAVNDTSFPNLRIATLSIDSTWISHHAGKLFSYVKHRYDYWTPKQIAYTKKQLTDYSNYDPAARTAILREGIVFIVKDYSINTNLRFYYQGVGPDTVSASENYLGLPWSINGRNTYNPEIPRCINGLLSSGGGEPLKRFTDTDPMPMLADAIYESNCEQQLPQIAVQEYSSYTDALRKDFTVLGASEAPLEWLEFKNNWPQTFHFTLQHPTLHPGIQLQYYASRTKGTLYPIDSLRRCLPTLVARMQHVKFLMDYLDENPKRKINVFFFDNRAVTMKHVDDFNKDSAHWKIHDFWVKEMEKYKTSKIKPSFDIDQSIETSKNVECGCNFRLDNKWLMQSILFELRDENDGSSTWLLLPDNTPVLWHFEGESVYKYSYMELGTTGRSVQYVCRKLDANGNFIGIGITGTK